MATETASVPLGKLNAYLRERVNTSIVLLLPLLIFEIGYFVVPFVLLVRISLYAPTNEGAYAAGTWSVQSYVNLLTADFTYQLLITTTKMAVVATLLTIVFSFIYAYVLWRARGWTKTTLLVTIVLPLLTTLVVKLYSWLLLLAPDGTVNQVLTSTVLTDPAQLMHNFFGVIVGLVYTTMPYATLAIYSVLEKMEWEVVEASRDLGASRTRSVYEIVVPAAVPGLVVATVITLTWNIGAYASPALLGSGSERTLSIETYYLLFQRFNWPTAAALSILMLGMVVLSVIMLFRLLGRLEGGIENVT